MRRYENKNSVHVDILRGSLFCREKTNSIFLLKRYNIIIVFLLGQLLIALEVSDSIKNTRCITGLM